jgi:hypothetical protein
MTEYFKVADEIERNGPYIGSNTFNVENLGYKLSYLELDKSGELSNSKYDVLIGFYAPDGDALVKLSAGLNITTNYRPYIMDISLNTKEFKFAIYNRYILPLVLFGAGFVPHYPSYTITGSKVYGVFASLRSDILESLKKPCLIEVADFAFTVGGVFRLPVPVDQPKFIMDFATSNGYLRGKML